MNTKLTLNIDDSVIRQAKTYAKTKKRSVSKLVEEYLHSISMSNEAAAEYKTLSPLTAELLGAIKLDKDVDYKDVLEQELLEKYR